MILFKIGMSTKIIELSKFFSFLWKEKCISKCQIVNVEDDFLNKVIRVEGDTLDNPFIQKILQN